MTEQAAGEVAEAVGASTAPISGAASADGKAAAGTAGAGAADEPATAPPPIDAPRRSREERDLDVTRQLDELYARLHNGALEPGDLLHYDDVDALNLPWLLGNAAVIRDLQAERRGLELQPDMVVFGGFTPADGTILDIGAHWGYSAVALRHSGTECEILSFEPLTYNCPSLEEFKTSDTGYDFVACALTDVPGELRLYTPTVNGRTFTGLNSANGASFTHEQAAHVVKRLDEMVPDADEYVVQLLETVVGAYRLDDMVLADFTPISLTRIAAMKIDVEGHEINVLRGAAAVFRRDRPFVMIEGGNREQLVAEFFGDRNYRYGEREGNTVVPVEGYSEKDNGYWYAAEREAEYVAAGIITPSGTQVTGAA